MVNLVIINMLMPVQQNNFTHLRVLLVLTDGRALAAETLAMLAGSDADVAAAVVAAGALFPLVELLSGGSDKSKKHASAALANLPLEE